VAVTQQDSQERDCGRGLHFAKTNQQKDRRTSPWQKKRKKRKKRKKEKGKKEKGKKK